jgi:hypothetical protein
MVIKAFWASFEFVMTLRVSVTNLLVFQWTVMILMALSNKKDTYRQMYLTKMFF